MRASKPRRRRLTEILVTVAVGATLGSELIEALASRPLRREHTGTCAVLVLGFPAHADGRPSVVQRLRMAAGLRGAAEHHCDLLVVSGGAAHNRVVEADAMAALAPDSAVTIVRERAATNTWENIGRSLPLLDGHGAIFVASEGLHARRAVRYLCTQRPTRCGDADIVATGSPWWMLPYRMGSVTYELWAWTRDAWS